MWYTRTADETGLILPPGPSQGAKSPRTHVADSSARMGTQSDPKSLVHDLHFYLSVALKCRNFNY